MSRAFIQLRQSESATHAPVIAAVRVPPSAWITSQSTVICRSPSAGRSTTARSERPIRRWISSVRPPCLPAEASRRVRSLVARGSMPYSAVTQPRPCPFSHGGMRSSRVAVTSTCVSPNFTKQEPSAYFTTPRSSVTTRSSSACRRLGRIRVPSEIDFALLLGGAAQDDKACLNACAGRSGWTILRNRTEKTAGVPGRSPRIEPGGLSAAQRALARDLPADRRELSRDRRTGRLAQSRADHSDDLVARLGAQRDGRPRAARARLRAAHLRRATADRAGAALLRRCADAGRRYHRAGPPGDRGASRGRRHVEIGRCGADRFRRSEEQT